MGAWLAVGLLLAAVSAVAAAFVVVDDDDDDAPAVAGASASAHAAGEPRTNAEPSADSPDAAAPERDGETRPGRSPEAMVWTIATPATLDELERAWSIPRATLAAFNPELPADQRLAAGTEVMVHAGSLAASESVGPPNDGRLVGGVPLPEARAWTLPADRSRAFATGETIAAITAALDTYAALYPDGEPIQIGDLSARRGGPISGHQSHQTGRDIDVRLIAAASGDSFDAGRNWSLVKAFIDGGGVGWIFLNRTQQNWLRTAAQADVGAAAALRYFAVIGHERGHTIHMHIRFLCHHTDKRCVNYSPPDTGEQVPEVIRKLPGGRGVTPARPSAKLPTLRPQTPPRSSAKLPSSPAKGR